MNRSFIVMSLCLALPAPLVAQDAAEKTPEEICTRVANYTPGPKARQTEKDRKLVGSGSLGHTVLVQFGDEAKEEREYDETRRYCLVKGDCDVDLAMIFANGWGIARDYDAATWFLCRLDTTTAPAEKDGMLAHVEGMRTAEEPEDLLYCDHATSTVGLLYCPQPSTGEEAPEDRMGKVREALSPEAARALDGLVTALDAFASEDGAVRAFGSLGGTGYPVFEVEAQTEVRTEHVSVVESLANSCAPGCTPDELKAADAGLNESYRRAVTAPWECTSCSDPDERGRETLRDAQRAWIRYRDAWLAFYQARWKGKAKPEALKREVVGALTLERSVQLDGIHAGERE